MGGREIDAPWVPRHAMRESLIGLWRAAHPRGNQLGLRFAPDGEGRVCVSVPETPGLDFVINRVWWDADTLRLDVYAYPRRSPSRSFCMRMGFAGFLDADTAWVTEGSGDREGLSRWVRVRE